MFAKRVRQPLPSGCPTRRHEHKTTRQPKPAVAQRRPTAVAHACRTPCPAPVWWFERCAQNPIPSRTRPLNAPAPMVLCLKTRESRSPPDLHRTRQLTNEPFPLKRSNVGAGWSSPVARQAHNLKVTGSNPVPATKLNKKPAPVKSRAGFRRSSASCC